MAIRKTKQNRGGGGQYAKNVRCDRCGVDLGQLDDGQYVLDDAGKFVCLECDTRTQTDPTGIVGQLRTLFTF